MQGTSEWAGHPDLVRHEAASLFQTDSSLTMLTPLHEDDHRVMAAAAQSGDVKMAEGPGEIANSSLHGRRSLASSPTKCDPIPGNGECPH